MKINIPNDVRMMVLHGKVVEWLCNTDNKHLIEPYPKFEDRMIDFLLNEPKTFTGTAKPCRDSKFHGIPCLEEGDNYGFEGCYNNDINHPDPRPGHRIWINKIHAEKLFRLFTNLEAKE